MVGRAGVELAEKSAPSLQREGPQRQRELGELLAVGIVCQSLCQPVKHLQSARPCSGVVARTVKRAKKSLPQGDSVSVAGDSSKHIISGMVITVVKKTEQSVL